MGKGFFISRAVAVACLVASIGAAIVIFALSVMFAEEKLKGFLTPAIPIPDHTPTEPWEHYRLPDTVVPVSYNLTLWPILKPNKDDLYLYTGNCTVVIRCLRETNLILLHSYLLNLTLLDGFLVRLQGLNGAPTPSLRRTWLEVKTEYLVVQLDGPLQVNGSYELYTEFAAELSDSPTGFFRVEYEEGGQKKVMVATQMQPVNARITFPCFDEPALKAVVHLTLLHPHGTVALSNSMNYDPVNITVDGEGLIQTSFEPTEIMSIYLLAFVVCDFAYIRTKPDADVLIRIWGQRKAIEDGHGDYALEKAGPILSFFEKYHNSSYPLKKSDQIAIPDFSGAMENWGLIMYEPHMLLLNPKEFTFEDKELLLTTVSHELAHMWFGNLVTLRWWSDLWLNEGLATYMSFLGLNFAEPTWNVNDSLVKFIMRAMVDDASHISRPLSFNEEELLPSYKISSLFDLITYKKGAAVVRMMSDSLTEPVFRKGLQTYLKEFQYKNTVPKDLFKHLQMAVNKSGLSLPRSVEEIMTRWTLQMGFPLVTIDTQTGRVTQEHFLADPEAKVDRPSEYNYTWFVPVTWIRNGGDEQRFWLLTKEATNSDMALGPSDWLLANINLTGYFRVNYDAGNWNRILNVLNSRPQDIPLLNRAQIIDDVFTLLKSKKVNVTSALRTTLYLDREVGFLPWERTTFHISHLFTLFAHSDVYGPFEAYFRKKITPLFQHYKNLTLNWTKISENLNDQYAQETAIHWACKLGVRECTELTSRWFKEMMDNSSSININLQSVVYCSALAAGGEEEWEYLWSKAKKNFSATQLYSVFYALSCTRQPWLLNRYLQYSLDIPEKIDHIGSYIIKSVARNPVGQPLAWDFVRANWDVVIDKFDWDTVSSVTESFCTEFELQQLLQLKKEKDELDVGSGYLQYAVKDTVTNMRLMAEYRESVLDWLKSEASGV